MLASHVEYVNIPVIDISNMDTQTGADLVNAIAKWGFVFVKGKGKGFTPDVIDATFQLVRSCASVLAPRL